MNRAFWIYSLWVSLLSAVFFFLYGYTGLTIGWMSFIILAVFFGMGSTFKDVPSCLCCIIAGLIWGQLDYAFISFEASFGVPAAAAMFIGITFMTTITMGLHLTVLRKTPFNKLPFIFAAVALTFSQNGENEVALVSTLVAGLLLAAACSLGERFIFARFAKPEDADAEKKEIM